MSVEQARRNLDLEVPDSQTFEATVEKVKSAWLEKLGRISIEGFNRTDADHDPRAVFYTGLFHALQYPSDFSEPTTRAAGGRRRFYSGYTDSVHEAYGAYYQSWSIWDTYRAEHSLLTLLAPERVNDMMRTLLRIFEWSGRLPMWANCKETNIMVGTNADAVLANALARGFADFDVDAAWRAVWKDAFVPPADDTEVLYYDREPGTSYEARAGLTAYMERGWVSNDGWAESASRTPGLRVRGLRGGRGSDARGRPRGGGAPAQPSAPTTGRSGTRRRSACGRATPTGASRTRPGAGRRATTGVHVRCDARRGRPRPRCSMVGPPA